MLRSSEELRSLDGRCPMPGLFFSRRGSKLVDGREPGGTLGPPRGDLSVVPINRRFRFSASMYNQYVRGTRKNMRIGSNPPVVRSKQEEGSRDSRKPESFLR